MKMRTIRLIAVLCAVTLCVHSDNVHAAGSKGGERHDSDEDAHVGEKRVAVASAASGGPQGGLRDEERPRRDKEAAAERDEIVELPHESGLTSCLRHRYYWSLVGLKKLNKRGSAILERAPEVYGNNSLLATVAAGSGVMLALNQLGRDRRIADELDAGQTAPTAGDESAVEHQYINDSTMDEWDDSNMQSQPKTLKRHVPASSAADGIRSEQVKRRRRTSLRHVGGLRRSSTPPDVPAPDQLSYSSLPAPPPPFSPPPPPRRVILPLPSQGKPPLSSLLPPPPRAILPLRSQSKVAGRPGEEATAESEHAELEDASAYPQLPATFAGAARIPTEQLHHEVPQHLWTSVPTPPVAASNIDSLTSLLQSALALNAEIDARHQHHEPRAYTGMPSAHAGPSMDIDAVRQESENLLQSVMRRNTERHKEQQQQQQQQQQQRAGPAFLKEQQDEQRAGTAFMKKEQQQQQGGGAAFMEEQQERRTGSLFQRQPVSGEQRRAGSAFLPFLQKQLDSEQQPTASTSWISHPFRAGQQSTASSSFVPQLYNDEQPVSEEQHMRGSSAVMPQPWSSEPSPFVAARPSGARRHTRSYLLAPAPDSTHFTGLKDFPQAMALTGQRIRIFESMINDNDGKNVPQTKKRCEHDDDENETMGGTKRQRQQSPELQQQTHPTTSGPSRIYVRPGTRRRRPHQ